MDHYQKTTTPPQIRCLQDALDWHRKLMARATLILKKNEERGVKFPLPDLINRLAIDLNPVEYMNSPRYLARPQDITVVYKRLEDEYNTIHRWLEEHCRLTGVKICEGELRVQLESLNSQRAFVGDPGPFTIPQGDEITNLIRHLQILVEDLEHIQATTAEEISKIVHRDYNPLKRKLWALAKNHDGTINWSAMRRLDSAGFPTFTFDGCLWVHVKCGALRGPKVFDPWEKEKDQ